ncbi:MAG TPA: hypothetical protein VKB56_06315 [Terriglobales bacterium]|nr:hypothetical protein [Terriglobales bacterium]
MITDNQRLTKIRMALIAIALGVLLVLALRARAQDSKAHPAAGMRQQQAMPPDTPAVPSAKPDDVKSIDAIIAATYDVISGPAGDRDWDRFRSLFIPEARLIPVGAAPSGGAERYRLLSVEDYVNRAGGNFKQNAFFENEVSRKQEQFGHIAHVFSTYESRRVKGEKPFARGINSFSLFNDGQRWWVVQIMWDAENPTQPIPDKYLH